METNKIDTIVRDSLLSRTIQPSGSAWERLSDQLDVIEQPKQMNWFKYAGYAASVLLLISAAFFMNITDTIEPITPNTIVIAPVIDTTDFIRPNFKEVLPIENAIVKTVIKQEQGIIRKKKPFIAPIIIAKANSNKLFRQPDKIETSITEMKSSFDLPKKEVTAALIHTITEVSIAESPFVTIKIDSDALLYSVTHSKEEVQAYYAKYDVNRSSVLDTIRNQLKNANLKIDANAILTSVEKTIDEETFKRSFMQVVKGKITGLASAISNRNK